ncbi:MAG: hypothetical protein DHS20C01_31140 [marine bacterium B5-7]|nr:MAG: hypothetical protein DHS20C01_31140 [marine bacterium B5-7]
MKSRKHRRRADTPQKETPFFSKTGGQVSVEAKAQEGFFQPKVTIGKPGDHFEQQADKMADAVVNRSRSGSNDVAAVRKKEKVQRQAEQEEEPVQAQAEEQEESVQAQEEEKEESVQAQAEEKEEPVQAQTDMEEESVQAQAEEKEESVQTQAEEKEVAQAKPELQLQGGEKEEKENVQAKSQSQQGTPAFAARLKQKQGKGRPLPPKVRAEMEASFDADFSAVRIHTDEEAAQLSKMLGAQAFTHGNDIFFNQGKFNPESSAGKHLLAHELTHTKQQGKK